MLSSSPVRDVTEAAFLQERAKLSLAFSRLHCAGAPSLPALTGSAPGLTFPQHSEAKGQRRWVPPPTLEFSLITTQRSSWNCATQMFSDLDFSFSQNQCCPLRKTSPEAFSLRPILCEERWPTWISSRESCTEFCTKSGGSSQPPPCVSRLW